MRVTHSSLVRIRIAWQVFWHQNTDRFASSQPVNKYSSPGPLISEEKPRKTGDR